MKPIEEAAYNLLARNFALDGGDSLLFIHSPGKERFGAALARACDDLRIDYRSVSLEAEKDYELPPAVARQLVESTAALISSRRSYTHTDGVRGAAATGVRVATNSQLN